MLNKNIRTHTNRHRILFPGRRTPLHAMLISSGIENRTTPDYDWHGMKRGKAPMTLFQYTISGKGRMRYEDCEYEMEEGSAMILHFPHDNRYWLPHGSSSWKFIYICCNGTEVIRLWQMIETEKGPKAHIENSAPVVALAQTIWDKMRLNQIRSAFESSSLAYQFSMTLLDELYGESHSLKSVHGIDRAIKLCENRFADPVGIEEMAEAAGYSRYHFTRLFERSQGVSPGEYLMQLRIRKSAEMLRSSGRSVKEIAVQCGFSDPNYFCKAFRKRLGISPGAFRRSGMY